MEDADYASTLTDIDAHIPKIGSKNMSKDLIKKFRVKLVLCRLSTKWLHSLTSYIEETLITVFPPISGFLTLYPSQCVPYTVSQQGSSAKQFH